MPELPEVQTTVDGINKHIKGMSIVDVWTDYKFISNKLTTHSKNQIKNPAFFQKFKKNVIKSKIIKAERRAKNILIHLSNNQTILVHMKMTGHLLYGKYKKIKGKWVSTEKNSPLKGDSFNQYIHLVFTLSNKKHLVLSDVRKFAKVTLIDGKALKDSVELSNLGPEPLTKNFGLKNLVFQLNKKPKGKIKTVLMDQTIIAGIGNIYSDEILWASNIHPLTPVSHINEKQMKSVWKNTRHLLSKGINLGGDSMSDYRNLDGERGKFQLHHRAYKKTGKACLKKGCKGTIKRIVVGGRGTHFCPVHQILL